ncbi:MAG: nuclear transport factor 2 family protein [Dehalococcoidia bacterium]|nr:nuclear transport factor 2 family protein [Dehalococcoidia bacterium]
MTYTPTEQANIDAIYRFMEAEAARDFETMYRFTAPDCVSYGPGGMVTRGHEEMHAYDDVFFASLESLRRSIIDMAADGDTAVFRYRAKWSCDRPESPLRWMAPPGHVCAGDSSWRHGGTGTRRRSATNCARGRRQRSRLHPTE